MDVIYIRIHGSYGQEVYTLLKILKGFSIPVVWEINAPLEEGLSLGRSKLSIAYSNFKRKCLARMVDATVCVTEEMKDYAVNQLGIKNSYSIPNGSDADLFSPEKRSPEIYRDIQDHFKLVWAGSTQYRWQGLDFIFDIAKEIEDIDPEISFIIIGNRQYLEDMNVPRNVRILDQKEYLDLAPFIATADAGLCFYHVHPNEIFYKSPLKLFDYMACGLPVIASSLGQIVDVIEDMHNGLLIHNGNIKDAIDRILYLKNNPQESKRIGHQARKTVEEYYNWERVAQETERVLESVLY